MTASTKMTITALIFGIAILQSQLWFAKGGIPEIFVLERQIKEHVKENALLTQRNYQLAAEIEDLKSTRSAVEEMARNKLGMIKENERFFMIIDRN